MPEFVSTDPENDASVRVHTARLLILDPCHLDPAVAAELVERGDAVLVMLTADDRYPVVVNEGGDIEVWNPTGGDDPAVVMSPAEAAAHFREG